MTNDILTKTVFFSVPKETVWEFLTKKDKLALWFHEAESDLEDGKPYALLNADKERLCWGSVLKMNAPHELVCSFTVGPLGGEMTTVTWVLDDMGEGTRLSLKHEGVAAAVSGDPMGLLTSLDAGWDEHFASLRQKLAQ